MTNQTPESVIAEIRHRRAYSVYGDGTAYLDIGRLLEALELVRAERDAATAATERVRAIIKTHVDYQLNREAKFGRTGTGCICEQCQILAALDVAPEPEVKK